MTNRIVQIALGLCLGVLVVEALAWWRDDGAFPHANFYVPDEKLGVRLRPHATERFRLGKNPLSKISVNSAGLRGAELPEPSANEVLVLGDSQVFGLGVNDYETFSHVLSKLMRRPVVNAGVPTYGPLEYNALAAELIEKRKPELVIYTVNMLNDLFENDRPNTARHRVWDGWAVRAETAPQDVFDFPGRTWLFSQSHAVYALRRYLHGDAGDDQSYASEGAWTDLIGIGQRRAQAITQQEANAQQARTEVEKLDAQIRQASDAARDERLPNQEYWLRHAISRGQSIARAHPGDIVRDGDAESSRPIVVTAELIQAAVRRRQDALAALAVAERENKRLFASAIKTRDDLKLRRQALIAQRRVPPRPMSVLSNRLRELRALCDANGCELLVIALPIDVQVSASEWQKYGHKPIDMSATTALADDLLSTAHVLGMRTLDALAALKAAEPGAFLDGDIHMTAKGHNALAWAIHRVLRRTATPTRQPDPGLPPGRTYPPSLDDELYLAIDVPVRNGDDTQCEARTQDEWVVVTCVTDGDDLLLSEITFAQTVAGGHGETAVAYDHSNVHLLAPVLANEEVRFEVEWRRQGAAEHQQRENATLIITRAKATDSPVLRFTDRTLSEWSVEAQRRARQFGPNAGAVDPAYWSDCPDGSVNGNALGHCLPLCGPNRSCEAGICEAWQGVDVCRAKP